MRSIPHAGDWLRSLLDQLLISGLIRQQNCFLSWCQRPLGRRYWSDFGWLLIRVLKRMVVLTQRTHVLVVPIAGSCTCIADDVVQVQEVSPRCASWAGSAGRILHQSDTIPTKSARFSGWPSPWKSRVSVIQDLRRPWLKSCNVAALLN